MPSALLLRWGPPSAVFVLAAACFLRAIGNGFVWDDNWLIVDRPEVQRPDLGWLLTTRYSGNYFPLVWLTYALEFQLWGLRPAGFHATNLLCHAINAVLVYFLILALRPPVPGTAILWTRITAAAGALLFAVHPLRVETVAWITERRGLMCGFFCLLTVLAYLRYAKDQRSKMKDQSGGGSVPRTPSPLSSRWWFALSVGACLLSLLCKPYAVAMPFVLLLLDAYPLGRLAEGRRVLAEKLPYLAMAVVSAVVTAGGQAAAGAMAPLEDHGLVQRLLVSVYGLCFYVVKTVVPVGLSPLYYLRPGVYPAPGEYAAAIAAVIALTAVLVAARRRWPAGLTAWLCYAVIVAPMLGLVQIGGQVAADRYSYLCCLPWAVLAAAGLERVRRARAWATLGAAVVLSTLAVLSYRQTAHWRDWLTLFTCAIDVDPENHGARSNRGIARLWTDDYRGAVEDLDVTLRHRPWHGRALANRALARAKLGEMAGAVEDADRAVSIAPRLPAVYQKRGLVRREMGDLAGAESDLSVAIELEPGEPEHLNYRGLLRKERGDLPRAIDDFSRAIALNPLKWVSYANRAHARHAAGDLQGALADFNRWIALVPNPDAYSARAVVRFGLRDAGGALDDLDAALLLRPDFPEAYVNRGLVRQAMGDLRGADRDYAKALEVAPEGWPSRRAVEEARRALASPER